MQKKSSAVRGQDKGFYIILGLCAAAIAISGYVLFFAPFTDGASMESVEYTPDIVQEDSRFPVVTPEDILPEEPVLDVLLPDAIPAEAAPEAPAQPEEKPATPAEQKPVWVQPVKGEVVQAWSGDTLVYHKTLGDWRVHDGTDYLAAAGTRVYAVANGEITAVTQDGLWGTSLTLLLKDGRTATYRGLSDDPKVKTGSKVSAGDVLGTVAAVVPAEADIGAHLHLELRDASGNTVDPQKGSDPAAPSKPEEQKAEERPAAAIFEE